MNIWLLRASEPMPVVDPNGRMMRMGMLAEELSKRGHNVRWFASTFNHFTKTQAFDKDTIVKVKENYYLDLSHARKYKKNISISRILNHMEIARKFKKKAKKLEKPDLIYVSYPIIEYAANAVKYGIKNDVPVIVDIRDLWPDIFKHNLSGVKKVVAVPYIWYMEVKAKKIMKKAFALNAVSEAMLEWGLQKGKRKKNKFDRFFYIGYKSHTNDNVANKIENENIDTNKFNISFFATINNQFDYDKIIELAKKLEETDKDIEINIYGDGPQMEELTKKVNGLSNVKLIGWLGVDELKWTLENSDIGLAPYKNTFDFQMSVSNKFAEYISYGLPIILTSEGYMKELIEKNKCGISSKNIDEICEYIVDIKNNKDKYNEASKNAKKLYEKDFVAEKIYKNLVDYLEEVKGEMKK